MKLFFIFLSLIFLKMSFELRTEDYANLVFDVYNAYQPSSILLVYFAEIDSKSLLIYYFSQVCFITIQRF